MDMGLWVEHVNNEQKFQLQTCPLSILDRRRQQRIVWQWTSPKMIF